MAKLVYDLSRNPQSRHHHTWRYLVLHKEELALSYVMVYLAIFVCASRISCMNVLVMQKTKEVPCRRITERVISQVVVDGHLLAYSKIIGRQAAYPVQCNWHAGACLLTLTTDSTNPFEKRYHRLLVSCMNHPMVSSLGM